MFSYTELQRLMAQSRKYRHEPGQAVDTEMGLVQSANTPLTWLLGPGIFTDTS